MNQNPFCDDLFPNSGPADAGVFPLYRGDGLAAAVKRAPVVTKSTPREAGTIVTPIALALSSAGADGI